MSFNGTEGEYITLAQGKTLTAAYRAKYPNGVKARFFGRDKLLEILSQDTCMGLRMYFALNGAGVMELVIVGADASENDMLDKILDMSTPCPNHCSSANDLNS